MKNLKHIFFILLSIVVFPLAAQNYCNGLPATDALGRKLPMAKDVGQARQKYVGLFYWTWHTNFAHMDVCIPSEYIAKAPEAAYDYNHPIWRKDITSNFWGEPLFGFYRDTDKWVLRKHAEMLAAAGVDVLFFDCTNGSFTWSHQAAVLVAVLAGRDFHDCTEERDRGFSPALLMWASSFATKSVIRWESFN